MKRMSFSLCLSLCLLLPFSLSAHQKVVIVPMGSPNIVGVYSTPYQYSSSDFWDNPSGGTTVLGTGEGTGAVPDGKRLFVQHISYRLSSNNVDGAPMCEARISGDETVVVAHPILLTRTTYGSTKEVFTANVPLMMYADSGMTVAVACWVRVTDDVNESFAVSGYYIDQ